MVLVNSETKKQKQKISNGFCLYSFMNSKCLVNYFVWNCQYFEEFENKLIKKLIKFSAGPQIFYHRCVYIAPSSDHSLLTSNLLFTVILRKFEVVFWCLEWECCTFQKIDLCIQIHQYMYYTMALIARFLSISVHKLYFPLVRKQPWRSWSLTRQCQIVCDSSLKQVH